MWRSQEKSIINQNDKQLAFSQLVRKNQDLVYRVCLRLLGNQQDAEDIAQDVFVKAFHSMENFRGDSDVATWLYRIAANLSLNQLSRRKRRRWLFLEFDNSEDEAADAMLLPEKEQPDQLYEQSELKKIMNRAINALHANQKTAFVLHKIEGLTNQKIADILNCTVSSVESRIHRAKKSVQKEIFKYYEEMEK